MEQWTKSESRTDRIEQTLARRQPGLVVVLENVHDPHNIGAILRSCDAVGVMRVMMLYTIEEPPKIGVTSASGAMKWIEFRRFRSVASCFDELHVEGFQILATKIEPKAASLYSYDLAKPTALVFGNEHRGISEEAASQADGLVYIPMMGMVESVNVSVAAAISLFEASRQRSAKQMYDQPQLSPECLRLLADDWIKK
ncbi:MAG TPA: TrmH family RNA methyltransferase [Candidatus Kapabacteria bacterium]|nr:TrmH family RNA methyltransferase [Candidatus Kapabacteria bacterium]